MPEPGYAKFNPSSASDGSEASFSASLDIANNIQITNTVKFDAGMVQRSIYLLTVMLLYILQEQQQRRLAVRQLYMEDRVFILLPL